jgi:hypothetical protein
MPLPLREVKFLGFTMKELEQFGYQIGDVLEGEGHHLLGRR